MNPEQSELRVYSCAPSPLSNSLRTPINQADKRKAQCMQRGDY